MTTADGPVGGAPRCGTLTTRMRSVATPVAGAAFCAVSDVTLRPVPSNRAAVSAVHTPGGACDGHDDVSSC